MKKIDMIKKIGTLVVSVGVGAIVGNAIKATTPSSINTINRVCIGIGAFVLTGMVSGMAAKYTEEQINETVNEIKKMVTNGDLN